MGTKRRSAQLAMCALFGVLAAAPMGAARTAEARRADPRGIRVGLILLGAGTLLLAGLAVTALRSRRPSAPEANVEPPPADGAEADAFSLPELPRRPPAILPLPPPVSLRDDDRTLPLPPPAAAHFPKSLPRGIGIRVLWVSPQTGTRLPYGWAPGDPIDATPDGDADATADLQRPADDTSPT